MTVSTVYTSVVQTSGVGVFVVFAFLFRLFIWADSAYDNFRYWSGLRNGLEFFSLDPGINFGDSSFDPEMIELA